MSAINRPPHLRLGTVAPPQAYRGRVRGRVKVPVRQAEAGVGIRGLVRGHWEYGHSERGIGQRGIERRPDDRPGSQSSPSPPTIERALRQYRYSLYAWDTRGSPPKFSYACPGLSFPALSRGAHLPVHAKCVGGRLFTEMGAGPRPITIPPISVLTAQRERAAGDHQGSSPRLVCVPAVVMIKLKPKIGRA